MKKIAWLRRLRKALPYVGVFVTVLGFYADKATSFPLVITIMSPRYAASLRAMTTLERTRKLTSSDDDFSALARLVAAQLIAENGRPVSERRIQQIELGDASIALGPTRAGEHIPFRILVEGQQKPIEADLNLVRTYVNDRGQSVLLRWSHGLFLIGIAITLFSMATEKSAGS